MIAISVFSDDKAVGAMTFLHQWNYKALYKHVLIERLC